MIESAPHQDKHQGRGNIGMGHQLLIETSILPIDESCRILQVALRGQITIRDRADLKERVFKSLRESIQGVILDLSEIAYIDSVGLGKLVMLLSSLNHKNIPLVLAGANAQVQPLFAAAHMQNIFVFVRTREEAIKHIQSKIA